MQQTAIYTREARRAAASRQRPPLRGAALSALLHALLAAMLILFHLSWDAGSPAEAPDGIAVELVTLPQPPEQPQPAPVPAPPPPPMSAAIPATREAPAPEEPVQEEPAQDAAPPAAPPPSAEAEATEAEAAEAKPPEPPAQAAPSDSPPAEPQSGETAPAEAPTESAALPAPPPRPAPPPAAAPPSAPRGQADARASMAPLVIRSSDWGGRIGNNWLPEYPQAARANNLEGTVRLEVLISRDGKPRRVRVVRSSGHASLDEAALRAVWLWRFKPPRYEGLPVDNVTVDVPITFRR